MLMRILVTFWHEEDGQDLVEYALLMAFIALAAVSILTNVQTSMKTRWNGLSNTLSDAVTAMG
jgi:Flp pilus assembly pilin Flp